MRTGDGITWPNGTKDTVRMVREKDGETWVMFHIYSNEYSLSQLRELGIKLPITTYKPLKPISGSNTQESEESGLNPSI